MCLHCWALDGLTVVLVGFLRVIHGFTRLSSLILSIKCLFLSTHPTANSLYVGLTTILRSNGYQDESTHLLRGAGICFMIVLKRFTVTVIW